MYEYFRDFVELLRNVRAAPDLENSKQMMVGVMNAFRYIQKLKVIAIGICLWIIFIIYRRRQAFIPKIHTISTIY